MKHYLSLLAAALLALPAFAQTEARLAHPESVTSDGRYLYVSNVGKALAPTVKDGDGFISRLTLQGQVLDHNIAKDTLHAPKGMAIINGVLYAADVDQVTGIELATGKKAAAISLAAFHTSLLNDIAIKDDHTLFVSATDIGKVFEVNLQSGEARPLPLDIPGANGICYDHRNRLLYVCSLSFTNISGGSIGVVRWRQGQPVYEPAAREHGVFDGLALLDGHTLLVSDWGALDHPAGVLKKIDLRSKTATRLALPIINGPADFYYAPHTRTLYLPAMVANTIIIKKI